MSTGYKHQPDASLHSVYGNRCTSVKKKKKVLFLRALYKAVQRQIKPLVGAFYLSEPSHRIKLSVGTDLIFC